MSEDNIASSSTLASSPPSRNPKIEALKSEIESLKRQLGDKDPEKVIQDHIKLLHTYNEIKDGTQSLIGRYAAITNKTITEVHRELGLGLEE